MRFSKIIGSLLVSSLTYLTLAHFSLAKAQIIPDGTLGTESSVVNPDTIKGIPSDRIDGGAIRGSNLFHSFSEFNIDSARGAYFTNPSGIENILTRVTGNNASQILGNLGVLGKANLFLINPNGIIFGKDAVLDIRGSFTATTADGIRFGENGLFSATNPQSSNLLTVKPGALFSNALSNQQATINNQGNLTVDAGKNINLFAANVINTGTLTAPKGIVQLTGTENLITRGNIATATLFLNTKNLTIGENENATVDKTTLEGLSGNTNLILQGTNDITVDALTNNTLNLANGSGKIAFIADADRDGIGNFQMDTADTIKTNGRDISISGASLTLGNIDTSFVKGGDIISVVDVDAGGDIPANGSAIFTFTVSEEQPIEDLDVQFSASNTKVSNLEVFLNSPSGQYLSLFYNLGGDGDKLQDTLLDDSAATSIDKASPPFQGRFNPTRFFRGLASFNGENPKGIWQLEVYTGGGFTIGIFPLELKDKFAEGSGVLYKAGETAPWGIADGTKLIFRNKIVPLGESGSITLNATNGSINVGNINAGNSTNGGEVNLSATENISLNGSLVAENKIKILADVDANGIGDFQMNPVDTIKTNGRNTEIAGVSLTVGNIDTSSQQGGGNITLTATGGNISTQDLDSSSTSESGNAGSGGAIAVTATQGNISTQELNSYSFSSSGNAGSGGAIALTTTQGNISTKGLFSHSLSSSLEEGNAGSGGTIALTTTHGNISTKYLLSYSFSNSINTGSGGALAAGFGGAIALTTTHGNISTQYLDSSSTGGDGGAIALTTTHGNISTQYLDSSSTGGDGGVIALTTTHGNISTQYLDSSSTGGDGGAITLTTTQGNISTQNLDSSSFSSSGNAGDGGKITLTTTQGNISTGDLNSYSYSPSGNAGDGGIITFSAIDGNIDGNARNIYVFTIPEFLLSPDIINSDESNATLNSVSVSTNGNSGKGGNVTLVAKNNITDLDILTLSSTDKSGDVQVNGFGDLSLTNTNIITSKQVTIKLSLFQEITLDVGGVGQSGNVNITSTGNLTFKNSRIESDTKGDNPAGNVTITSPGTVTFNNSKIVSNTSSIGNAGNIQINANNLTLTDTSEISANTTANGKAGDITLNTPTLTLANGGKIFATTTGNGDGGKITVNAPNLVNLGIGVQDFAPILSVETSGAGKAGNIIVNTPTLTISDTARITATATNTATNTQEGGSITLNASNMNLAGIVGVFAETQGQAPAGRLTLQPYENHPDLNLTLFPGSKISASTSGSGNGGDLIVKAPETINISGQGTLAVETSSNGNAGNIEITTQNLNLTDGVTLSAATSGIGKAGDIVLNTPTLNLTNGSKIFATTSGSGDGGTISVNALNSVNIGKGVQDFAPILSVETTGAGKAGDIIVNTPNLIVSDTARITATATATATNTKGGGSITLNASKLDLAGIVGIFAETQGQAPAGTLKLNPYQNQPNLDITLFPNSTISASTSGSGKGGDLILSAPENINIAGNGKLAVESTGIGDAGNILITTQNLNINDGVKISASTMNGQGGNININAHTLTANNGAQFLTTTSGTAKAGNINVQVRDNITLDGTNTGLFANTEKTATGDSGNITIDPEIFIIKNGAGIGVNSNGSGKGGNISLAAGTLTLDNQAFINAATTSNNGGEITLDIQDFLFVRRNSNITATAGTDFAGGNGGNITINSPFIIAIAAENSDITANAFSGQGGNINISTQGIFGIGFQAQQTAQSGITASSELGISGNVTINTPEVDPSKGLVQLSTNLVDASRQIDNSCQAGSKQSASSFTITGRGGLPFNPYEYLQTDSIVKKWVSVDNHPNSPGNSQSSISENPSPQEIVEAQGLMKDENGDIYLVAQASQVIPHSPTLTAATCASSR
ncbi:filamentous hemagglutinin outer membrane protein [Calothrix brevissima NIES-22]|nr:filamentous hemagglutinin outer membrane protein [Calothrix brevissima NIES-22]